MKAGETTRQCRACKKRKLIGQFREWSRVKYQRFATGTDGLLHSDVKVRVLCHARVCLDCEEEMQRASDVLAYGRPKRAERYTTDTDSLSVVDVRRLIRDGLLTQVSGVN